MSIADSHQLLATLDVGKEIYYGRGGGFVLIKCLKLYINLPPENLPITWHAFTTQPSHSSLEFSDILEIESSNCMYTPRLAYPWCVLYSRSVPDFLYSSFCHSLYSSISFKSPGMNI